MVRIDIWFDVFELAYILVHLNQRRPLCEPIQRNVLYRLHVFNTVKLNGKRSRNLVGKHKRWKELKWVAE